MNSSTKGERAAHSTSDRADTFKAMSRVAKLLSVIRDCYPELLRQPRSFLILSLLSMIQLAIGLITLVFPYLSKHAIDVVIPQRSIRVFWHLAGIAAVLYLLRIALDVSASYISTLSRARLCRTLRDRVFGRLIDRPLVTEMPLSHGSISRRLMDDITAYVEAILNIVPTTASEFLTFIALCIVVGALSNVLLMLMMISIPLILTTNAVFSRCLAKLLSEKQDTGDREVNVINASAEGLVTIRSFGVMQQFKAMFRSLLDKDLMLERRYWFMGSWRRHLEWMFSTGLGVIALWAAYYLVLRGTISLGAAVAAIMYFGLLLSPVIKIANMTQVVAAALVAADRIFELTQQYHPGAVGHTVSSACRLEHGGDSPVAIRAHDISFSYPDHLTTVFDRLSIEVHFGRMTGIVGPSGSGKTTLAKILAGHFHPDRGTVLYNSRLLSNGHRPNVLYCPDEMFYLPASLRDNIRFFACPIDETRMERCLAESGIKEVISVLPDGLDTRIGGEEIDLSKGEQQRLLIARALYSIRPVVILDEVTNNIDVEGERTILRRLRKRAKTENLAIVLISHRPQAMQYCDEIISLLPRAVFI